MPRNSCTQYLLEGREGLRPRNHYITVCRVANKCGWRSCNANALPELCQFCNTRFVCLAVQTRIELCCIETSNAFYHCLNLVGCCPAGIFIALIGIDVIMIFIIFALLICAPRAFAQSQRVRPQELEVQKIKFRLAVVYMRSEEHTPELQSQ